MLSITCEHCQRTLQVRDEYLGQSGRCNYCGGRITVLVAPLRFSAETIAAEAKQEAEKASCEDTYRTPTEIGTPESPPAPATQGHRGQIRLSLGKISSVVALVMISVYLLWVNSSQKTGTHLKSQASTTNEGETSNLVPRDPLYSVERVKPGSGADGISFLNVTFSRTLDVPTAERILREETQRAVTAFPASKLMAYAWIQTEPTPGSEKRISLSDGSNFLAYSPDLEGVLTEKEFSAAKTKPPETGKALQVELSVDLERESNSRVCVRGSTNLPDGMLLMVVLRDSNSDYGTHEVFVTRGGFVSEWLADGAATLPSGTYEINIISPFSDFQPEQVKGIIGEDGRNLEGPVKSYIVSKFVDLTVQKELR